MNPFCYLCFVFFCHTNLSVPCSLVITCWGSDDLWALLYVMFLVFLSLFHMVVLVRCGVDCVDSCSFTFSLYFNEVDMKIYLPQKNDIH